MKAEYSQNFVQDILHRIVEQNRLLQHIANFSIRTSTETRTSNIILRVLNSIIILLIFNQL